MWNELIAFLSLADPNVRWVALGALLIGGTTGCMGVFAYLQKRSLVGDAIAHAMLPGVAIAFLLSGSKHSLALSLGAIASGGVAWWVVGYLIQHTKLKSDTVLAIVLSVFYGFGVLLLSYIQQQPNMQQSGLDRFLFGKIASTTADELLPLVLVAGCVLVLVLAGYAQIRVILFDADYAYAHGYAVRFWESIIALFTIAVVSIGIQAVGVVLLAALLITPALVARYWTNSLGVMFVLASLVGAFSGVMGAFISYTAPRMPTGPWIVVVLSVLAFLSAIASYFRISTK
ncbi:MAG: metal ABC transporter permease [Bacteroidetes bacterium]|nr:MAG: metal ABC transporter permease [Bacteroidota bacterium]